MKKRINNAVTAYEKKHSAQDRLTISDLIDIIDGNTDDLSIIALRGYSAGYTIGYRRAMRDIKKGDR